MCVLSHEWDIVCFGWVGFWEEMRPPLKISLFPVDRPGELNIRGKVCTFFRFQRTFVFYPVFSLSCTYRKKSKNQNAPASQLAMILGTRWTENKLTFPLVVSEFSFFFSIFPVFYIQRKSSYKREKIF